MTPTAKEALRERLAWLRNERNEVFSLIDMRHSELKKAESLLQKLDKQIEDLQGDLT